MSNLMELVSQVTAVMDLICEDDGSKPERLPALEADLRDLIAAEENKVGAIALVMQRMESRAEAYRLDAAVLHAAADRIEGERERLRRYVLDVMLANGVKSMKSPLASFSVLPPKERVEVYDEPAVPFALRAEIKNPPPDKAAIKRALEAGETVPGARLVTGEPSLSVRMAKSKAEVVA